MLTTLNMKRRRKIMVSEAFADKVPTSSMFQIVEEPIPLLRNGQFLVQAEYISVDPYMRSFAENQQIPYMQFGFQVSKVIETKNKKYPVDSYVVSHSGWCDFAVLDGSPDEMFAMTPYPPPVGNRCRSLALGVLGMPGMTAYLGFLHICAPAKRNVVCVTSACGAVGSLVGQIARIVDCIVIGFTGSDTKVKVLKQLGFHHAYNYKSGINVQDTLRQIAPNGIDCFFDNVGGTLSENIMKCMGNNSRVAICGAISTYGQHENLDRTSVSVNKSVHIESFSFTQWNWSTQSDAIRQMDEWIDKDQIKVKETIVSGFEKLPDTFIGVLKGENIGKAVVKI